MALIGGHMAWASNDGVNWSKVIYRFKNHNKERKYFCEDKEKINKKCLAYKFCICEKEFKDYGNIIIKLHST